MRTVQASSTIWRKSRFAEKRTLLRKDWRLYVLLLPGVVYFALFKYLPMWGILFAFQNYVPHKGVWSSEWVGFAHFIRFFQEPAFWMLFKNTMILAVLNLFIYFPIPIILALLLNELRSQLFKRVVQTVIYIPHFISWVVVVGIFYILFTTEGGLVNEVIKASGGDTIAFLLEPDWFRTLITSQVIWKEAGWGTIIFLAALTGVDPGLYEAARMDGANRWHQIWHITLPAIRSTIVIMFILRLGNFLDSNFEQIFLMINPMNREIGEVYDTYVYTVGLQMGQFSYTTAVNLFKNGVGLILIVVANYMAKKFGEEGVY
ncbi:MULTISPECIES: ABC transporter permease [unclassified Paenibacillus]|uniref:ABC transporter permease n=1 Tax=unclassified Paenibacillus TaxID=185978 RepID=UPI0036334E11